MKALASIFLASVLSVVLIPGVVGSSAASTSTTSTSEASSDTARKKTPRCVTKREFKRSRKRMRIRRVHRIYDVRGRFIDGGAGGFVRDYKFCKGARRKAKDRRFTVTYRVVRKGSRLKRKNCGPARNPRRCFR